MKWFKRILLSKNKEKISFEELRDIMRSSLLKESPFFKNLPQVTQNQLKDQVYEEGCILDVLIDHFAYSVGLTLLKKNCDAG